MIKSFKVNFLFMMMLLAIIDNGQCKKCYSYADVTNCQQNECCIKRKWPFSGFMCKNKGSVTGNRCGGMYTCGCTAGLICAPDAPKILNYFREGTGTCRKIWVE